jgi:hypothetical protein
MTRPITDLLALREGLSKGLWYTYSTTCVVIDGVHGTPLAVTYSVTDARAALANRSEGDE